METTLSSATRKVIISGENPTRLIGERINPTNRKKLAAELQSGSLEFVLQEAVRQIEDGADILDVNVGAAGVDDVAMLPQAVQAIMEKVDVPLCIDTPNPKALKAALEVYQGRALVNSVNGEEKSLEAVLPLVAEHDAAVIGLTMDDDGIPEDPAKRLEIARKIITRAEALGIARENVVIDCLAMSIGANSKAGAVTLETIRLVKEELGVNMTMGASNISFGLPDREAVNRAFLPMIIMAGVTCPIVNAAKVRDVALATDLLMGRDDYAMNYIKFFRSQQKKA